LLEELAKIKSGDEILPTVSKNGQPNKTIRLRCVTEPDPGQKVLLHRLGIRSGIDPLRMFDVAEDIVRPAPDTAVSHEATVKVTLARPVTIEADGRSLSLFTQTLSIKSGPGRCS
jgi:hypothetical protein